MYANSQCDLVVRDASKAENAQNAKKKFDNYEQFMEFTAGLRTDTQFHKRRQNRD